MPAPKQSGGIKTVLSLVPVAPEPPATKMFLKMALSGKRLQNPGNNADFLREPLAPSTLMPVYSHSNAS